MKKAVAFFTIGIWLGQSLPLMAEIYPPLQEVKGVSLPVTSQITSLLTLPENQGKNPALSLLELIEEALANNPGLRAADHRIKAAKTRITQERWALITTTKKGTRP